MAATAAAFAFSIASASDYPSMERLLWARSQKPMFTMYSVMVWISE